MTCNNNSTLNETNSTSGFSSSSSTSSAYNTNVFWAINVVVFSLAFFLTLWCICTSTGVAKILQRIVRERGDQEQQQEQEQQVAQDQLEKNEQDNNRDTPEQRRQKLEECFRTNQTIMVVAKEDFLLVEESPTDSLAINSMEQGNQSQESEQTSTGLKVSPAAAATTTRTLDMEEDDEIPSSLCHDGVASSMLLLKTHLPQPRRAVQNLCAVCLSTFAVGDEIVWSPNPDCQHAFHHDCILEWLMKMYRQKQKQLLQQQRIVVGGTATTDCCHPCPCCRQDFANLATMPPPPPPPSE